jgi:rubrerythrin
MSDRLRITDGDADTAQVALYDRTRREALQRGLIAGGGVLCASAVPALLRVGRAFAAAEGDDAVLRAAVGLEQTAVVAYGAALAGGELNPGLRATVRRIRGQEREHAAALSAALRKLGGAPPRPPRPQEIRGLQALRTQRELVAFAIELENMAVAAYYEGQQKLHDAALLRTTAQIMANEGQHLVVLRQALGRDPVPEAFETGKRR